MRGLLLAILALGLPSRTQKPPAPLHVRVAGAGIARELAPVTLELRVGGALSAARANDLCRAPSLGLADGKRTLPLQIEARRAEDGALRAVVLRWVEPSLGPKQERVHELIHTAEPTDKGFQFVAGKGFKDLLLGEDVIYRHMTAFDPHDLERTKKTFHHLFGFDGKPITKGPGGLYPHHRGLFLGWNHTRAGKRRFDFWHCNHGETQRYRGDRGEVAGPVMARTTSSTDWVGPDGEAVIRDERQVTVWNQGRRRRLADFVITLHPLVDEVRLDGDPQHAGFQFRAAQAVAEHAKETLYLRPESAKGGKNDVWSGCDWVAQSFTLRGQRHTVVHMDHSSNPRPIVYSTRAYGRFGSFFRTTLKKGEPLTLRYRVLLFDHTLQGPRGRHRLTALYQDFVHPLRATLEKGA